MRERSCREQALGLFPELKPIEAELEIYESLLRRWQAKINLVSSATLDDVWLRHFADSAQVHAVAPHIRCWADLGSGAGFPGLVTALLLKSTPDAVVHLIESDQRKAAFSALFHVKQERLRSFMPSESKAFCRISPPKSAASAHAPSRLSLVSCSLPKRR